MPVPSRLDIVNHVNKRLQDGRNDELGESYNVAKAERQWAFLSSSSTSYPPSTTVRGAARATFSLLLPLFAVTGTLQLVQALTCTVGDTLAVLHSMLGSRTLMLPGTIQGGVAGQAEVEKLVSLTGREVADCTRNGLVDREAQWHNSALLHVARRLGTSFDWEREVATNGDKFAVSLDEAFKRLHSRGLITRETRHVNWCCALRTVISQSDMDYIQIHQPVMLTIPLHSEPVEFGIIYAVSYPLAPVDPSDSGFVRKEDGQVDGLVVLTTRPETILADVALAVHSSDERYLHLRGRQVLHPLLPGRRLPIVVDDTLADPKAGNGVAKVAPGHEPRELECARRHDLPVLSVFSDNGTIKQDAGAYEGLPRYVARRRVLHDLRRDGLLRGQQAHAMTLALCSHTGDVIELVLKDAWWMNCDDLARRVNDEVNSGRLRMIPADYKPVMNVWLSSVQPWCISRQLPVGNRVPAYRITVNGQPVDSQTTPADLQWIVASDEQTALRIARERLAGQCPPEAVGVAQDVDVLDTWFTAAVYPLVALGWPQDATADYRDFFPHSMVVAPHDQLFYWVARMAMLGLALTGEVPFKAALLHPLVRDKAGRKMGAQLGNVIYPHDVVLGQTATGMEEQLCDADKQAGAVELSSGVPALGSDALRMGLLASLSHTNDIHFDVQRIAAFRHFIAAMWQLARFAFTQFEAAGFERSTEHPKWSTAANKLSLPERWVLNGLFVAVCNTQQAMDSFNFSAATAVLYDFCLHQLCGTFFETHRLVLPSSTLDRVSESGKSYLSTLFVCLHTALRLLHPFVPLVTEQLYQRLGNYGTLHKSSSDLPSVDGLPVVERLASCPYPLPAEYEQWRDVAAEEAMHPVLAVARAAGFVRSKFGFDDETRPDLLISCTKAYYANLSANEQHIATLGHLRRVTVQLAGQDGTDDALWSTQPASTPLPPSDKLCYPRAPKQRFPLALSEDVKCVFEWQPSGLMDSDGSADDSWAESTCRLEQQLWEAEHHIATIHVLMDQPRYLQSPASKKRQWQHELGKLHRARADYQQQIHSAMLAMSDEQRRRYATYRLVKLDSYIAKVAREVQLIDSNQHEQQHLPQLNQKRDHQHQHEHEQQQRQQKETQRGQPPAASTAYPASNVNGKQEIVSDSVKRRRLCMKLKWLRDRRVTAEAETAELHSHMEVQSN